MRGRGGFLELGTKFENVFLLHILKSPTNYVSEKLPPFSGVHKVPQKEPFIVRPGLTLGLVTGQLTKYLFFCF